MEDRVAAALAQIGTGNGEGTWFWLTDGMCARFMRDASNGVYLDPARINTTCRHDDVQASGFSETYFVAYSIEHEADIRCVCEMSGVEVRVASDLGGGDSSVYTDIMLTDQLRALRIGDTLTVTIPVTLGEC